VSDPDLVARARAGDTAAWESIITGHQEAVFRLAYLLLGDPADAEDAAQETFIRAYHALDRFEAERPLRPWLMQIAANLARNRRRSIGRYVAALRRALAADPELATHASAEQARRDDADLLWQAVRRLDASDQEIVYLRFFLDLPVDETAQALGIAEGTVKSRLHRALGRLRTVVERDFPSLREEETS